DEPASPHHRGGVPRATERGYPVGLHAAAGRPVTYTFYSYKGGVGRSMALANVANWLRLQGLRVVMVDWDLEAPGLESFFFPPGPELEEIRSQLGLMDALLSYKRSFPRAREALRDARLDGREEGGTLEKKVSVLDDLLPPLQATLHPIEGIPGSS